MFSQIFIIDDKLLSDYKITDSAKLHVSVKKVNPSRLVPKEPEKPKYKADDFWPKFEEVLMKHYDSDTSFEILSQFRKVINMLLHVQEWAKYTLTFQQI